MRTCALFFLFALLSVACSPEPKQEENSGVIDKATTKAAQEMVRQIEQPLDKAREAAALEARHRKELHTQAD